MVLQFTGIAAPGNVDNVPHAGVPIVGRGKLVHPILELFSILLILIRLCVKARCGKARRSCTETSLRLNLFDACGTKHTLKQ